MNQRKIKSFTDLIAWQKAHTLVLLIYKITDKFPQKEIYALRAQITRAVVSISSNIAEGFSRGYRKEKTYFYRTALGSLTEVQDQLLVAKDLGYIDKTSFLEVANLTIEVSKLLNGLIKSLRESYQP